MLSTGEMITLVVAAMFGGLLVFSAYYFTSVGIPPALGGLRGVIESVTGKTPDHPSIIKTKSSPTTKKDTGKKGEGG